jgi:hypothetical protein
MLIDEIREAAKRAAFAENDAAVKKLSQAILRLVEEQRPHVVVLMCVALDLLVEATVLASEEASPQQAVRWLEPIIGRLQKEREALATTGKRWPGQHA